MKQTATRLACAVCVAATLLVQQGCSDGAQLEVLVCGDLVETGSAQAVRVAFLDDELIEQNAAVFELGASREWPAQTAIEVEGSAGWLRATAIVDGAPSARFERRISKLERVSVVLDSLCVGQVCARGQACIAGACSLAPADQQDPNCQISAGINP